MFFEFGLLTIIYSSFSKTTQRLILFYFFHFQGIMSPISTRKSSHIYKQRKLNDNDRVSLVENKRAQKERTHSNNFGLSYDAQLSIENNSQCLSSNTDAKLFANFSSTRDICIRMLRNHELLLNRKGETNRTNNCQDEMRRLKCKSCDAIGYSTMMLICDNCEGPFHLKCSGVFSRKVLPDEWYCHPCSRKKRRGALPNMSLGSGKVMKRSAKHGRENSSKSTSSIRIGEDFQAEVQEWFGPIHEYVFLS